MFCTMTPTIRMAVSRTARKALPVLIACLLLAGWPIQAFGQTDSLTQEVIDLITGYHVSGVEVEALDTASIEAALSSLNDPHSEYFSREEWQQFMNNLENNYTGIGIRLGSNETGFFVIEVFPDTPAQEAGMREGDYVVGVDGEGVDGHTLDQLVRRITGEEGTVVTVTVKRNGETVDLVMQRRDIHLPVITSGLIEPGIGYMRVTSFSSDADELFGEETRRLLEAGMQALVLDLRNNPGGLLDSAAGMAARFMEEGVLIHTRDRSGLEVPYPIGSTDPLDVPVIILVNEYSASASEVLAGSLQDYGIATLVGQKTYGKGSVQAMFELSDGSVLKLTIQEYLTPKKRPVNQVGLRPDVAVIGDAAQLITALQMAGDINVRLQLTHERMIVNGNPVLDRFPVIRENSMVYVPSRVLAALMEGTAEWDADQRAVLIRTEDREVAYDANSEGVLLKNGTSFIALNRFQTQFSAFAWSDRDGVLTLIEDGGN